MSIERYNPNPNAGINALIRQSNARLPGGGQMYAGGDPGFNERTGQRANEWLPQPRNGDSYLAMLMKKYGGAAQGFGQEIGGWLQGRLPNANRQYMDYRHQAINRGVDGW